MQSIRTAYDEPIPGYRLISRLGQGGFGEVWKCEAPGGLHKAIKFVSGRRGEDRTGSHADQELRALHLIKSFPHPFLLSIERIETLPDGDLALVTELAECSLHDLLENHRHAGRNGVPRGDALAYLHEAAEVLDLINLEYGLQHLDIKPRNLFLVRNHVKVGDFGQVASLADRFLCGGDPDSFGGVTPLYAAPEIFENRVTLFSDQYSLAVTYHELITGEVVFQGKNLCAQIFLVTAGNPDLSRLSEADRPVVSRALSKEPRERYRSCTDFIEALLAASPPTDGRFSRARTTAVNLQGIAVGAPGTSVGKAVPGSPDLRLAGRAEPAGTGGSGASRRPANLTAGGGHGGPLLPGIQLQECLQRGPYGEWWRATGPRGDARLVRFLAEAPEGTANDDLIANLLALDHPALAELKVLPAGPDRLALVSEAGDSSLLSQTREAQSQGRPGLPRDRALDTLGQVATALDELREAYQLQHLLLSPRHIAFSKGSVILLEYGLGELCWLPRGVPISDLSPRYAAAELFHGEVSPTSDQYSLALMYPETVVGLHPFRNLNAKQMLTARRRSEPDLSLLTGPERLVLQKALSPEPGRRFANCAELIMALRDVGRGSHGATVTVPVASTDTMVQVSGVFRDRSSGPVLPLAQAGVPSTGEHLEEVISHAARGHQLRGGGDLYYRVADGRSLEHRAMARLAPGMARLKLAGLWERWRATVLYQGPARFVFQVRGQTSLWGQLTGQAPALNAEVAFASPQGDVTPVRVSLAPVNCSGSKAVEMLGEMGPALLASLQTYLGCRSAKDDQARFPLDQPIFVNVPATRLQLSAQMRDIGRQGLAFYANQPLPVGPVTLTLTRPGGVETFTLGGRIRDCQACVPEEGSQRPRFEAEVSLVD